MANLFKGFKQVIANEGMTLENGYLYLVRTNENKADGYLYLNGKKYGTAADVKAELLGNIAEGDAKTFEAVNLAINELAETIGDDTKGLVKEVATLRADMESLSGGEGSISTQISNAIQALDLPNTYEEKGAAAAAETAAKAYTDALANGAVKTNTEAIATLNGTGEGSVDKKVADAIAEVVANAPENLDTLKEIADYIASDPQGVAELSNKVTALEGKAHTHDNKEVIDGITAEKVAAWDGSEAAAKAYADGLAANYDAAGAAATAESNAKAYTDEVADELSELASTLITNKVKNVETSVKEYADQVAATAESNAKNYTDSRLETVELRIATNTQDISKAETNAKAYADGLAANYDAAGAAATAEANAKAHADGLNTAMNTRVEALEAIDHEHANKTELDLIQSGDVAKWNAAITVDGDDVD